MIWLEVDFLEVSTRYEDQIRFVVIYDFANNNSFVSVFREARASTHFLHPLLHAEAQIVAHFC